MKKRLMSILITLCMVLALLPTAVFAADTATPSSTRFVINGKSLSVTTAYVINDTNYLQFRAIASMLNGTSAQFDVNWDGQYAVIEPGKPYSGTITETKLKKTTDVRKSDTKFKMNGKVFTLVKGNQYAIQSVESGKWWTSSGTKGSVLTQTDSGSIGDANLFTFIKQKDGTYRIMDSNGFYVGISNGDVDDYTNVILWTEASDGSQTYLFEKIN